MYAIYFAYICIFICFVIATRIYFVISSPRKLNEKAGIRHDPVKTMIILGSGGHTAEMIRILKYMDFSKYSPRVYVCAKKDELSVEKLKNIEKKNTDYKIQKIRRSREIRQSYFTAIYTTLYAVIESIPLLWSERPELLLCNGPGTCVPLCIVAFVFKLLYITQTTIVFIESFCRVKTLSLTGKILYYIADYQIIQWPYIHQPDNKNDRTLYF